MTALLPLLPLLALLALLATSAHADPSPPTRHALETHPALAEWTRDPSSPPAPDEPHTVIVALALPAGARETLEEEVYRVSDPRSPGYGQYLGAEQVAAIVGASPGRVAVVREWLLSFSPGGDVSFFGDTRDYLRAVTTVGAAERAFGVRLERFRHRDGRFIHRSLQPHAPLPPRVAREVAYVHGLNSFPVPSRRSAVARVPPPKAAPASAGSSNAPLVASALSRGPFSATFVPVCAGGAPSTTASPPCSGPGEGPSVASFLLRAESVNPVVGLNRTVEVSASCKTGPPVLCAADLTAAATRAWLGYYAQVNVTVASRYTDGTTSAWGANKFPVLPTPPVTPQTLRALYSVPRSLAGTNSSNSICVGEFEQQYYDTRDLKNYLSEFGLDQSQADRVRVVGPNPPDNGTGVEALLDIESAMGMADQVPMTFWSIRANSSVEIDDILTFCLAWMGDTRPPLVVSLSYGMTSANVDKYQGAGYRARSFVEFAKVAARGFTLVIASGDTGAGDLGPPPMSLPTCDRLHPDWPSESEFVTAVGSTAITPFDRPACLDPASGVDCSADPPGEVAVSLEQGLMWTAGGGMSDAVPRPRYQDEAVESFLAASKAGGLLPPAGVFNATGRAYPDIDAVGHSVVTSAFLGTLLPVDGTSASAPIFAGLVALLNDARLNAGMPRLGFLNPWLYRAAAADPGAVQDVVVGSNRCGAYVPPGSNVTQCCNHAFHAVAGFDAVSGWGSPNFEGLLRAALSF